MPADGVMRQGARGLGQNHREGDENERLPKFGNFEPDQKCDEGRARRRKETTEGALRKIVSLGCEPGRQIKQDRKSTRLNSSHRDISYAVFCLKKKKQKTTLYSQHHQPPTLQFCPLRPTDLLCLSHLPPCPRRFAPRPPHHVSRTPHSPTPPL